MKQLSLDDLVRELTSGSKPKRAKAATRRRRPETSKAAADSMTTETSRLRGLVLDQIRSHGAHGATCDELEAQLKLRHQTCSARVYELRHADKIIDSGQRRLTRSNRRAAVWVAA